MTKAELMKENEKLKNAIRRLDVLTPTCRAQHFKGMGRGVLAMKDIKEGDIFLECELIQLSPGDVEFVSKTVLQYYLFTPDNDLSPFQYMSLGVGALFNHHDKLDNAEWYINEEEKRIYFKARADIEEGEQIFIDYNWGRE